MAANPDGRRLILMLLMFASSLAAESADISADVSVPSRELLLYMAEFADDEGTLVDPLEVEQLPRASAPADSDSTAERSDPREPEASDEQ
jgi:hypothetical protein